MPHRAGRSARTRSGWGLLPRGGVLAALLALGVLLAGFAAAEIDKHFADDRYGHLNRHEAKRLAREQADYLWQQQYGRY